MNDPTDPGWPPLRRSIAGMVLPGMAVRKANHAPDGLLVLRSLFLSFAGAVVLIGLVTVLITTGDAASDAVDVLPAALLTAVVGAGGMTLSRIVDRPLDCTDPAALAASYRTRLFIRLALAEIAVLAGFVFSILSGSAVAYVVGLGFTAVGFARLAPTAANLATDQEQLTAQGCGVPLVPALRGLGAD